MREAGFLSRFITAALIVSFGGLLLFHLVLLSLAGVVCIHEPSTWVIYVEIAASALILAWGIYLYAPLIKRLF